MRRGDRIAQIKIKLKFKNKFKKKKYQGSTPNFSLPSPLIYNTKFN
jgi:hypothetical protein